MTPKEKAFELILKIETELIGNRVYRGNIKKLALITVNEIINAIDWNESEYPVSEELFWLEVIEEIEKL